MFKNYIKVAFRNLIKHKFYSVINIAGLAIGIAACLLMLLYVQDELSYDKFHDNSPHIYRLNGHLNMGNSVSSTATVSWPVTPALMADFPEIIAAAKIYNPHGWGNTPMISYEDQRYLEEEFLFADASILDIFTFEFLLGNPETALKSPNHVIISESTARKYFGDVLPMGQSIRYNNGTDFEVAGVVRDLPSNSHMKFDFIASFEGMRAMWNNWQGFDNNWAWVAAWSYLLLPNETTANRLAEQLPAFVQRHYPSSLQEGGVSLSLQAMEDIHLHSHLELEFEPNNNMAYIYVFSAIAGLILLIACINFMNLATARSAGRAREVGMRKVLGAYRWTLMKQFLGEALLLSFVSMITAVLLIELALPWFNQLTGKALQVNYFDNALVLGGLFVLGLLVGIMSGSYPAFFLSAFRPVEVLKGALSRGAGSSRLREILVTSQFVISIALLICIGVIYNQLDYLKNKDLGFDKEQIVLFNMYGGIWNQFVPFKNELMKSPAIHGVTAVGGSVPGSENSVENAYIVEGISRDQHQWLGTMRVNHDFVDVLGLEMLDGRPFSPEFSADSTSSFILNETAVAMLGWADKAVGKKIDHVNTDGSVITSGQVVGVVKDFHFRPLQEPLKPLIIRFGGGKFAVKMTTGNVRETLAHIEATWNRFVPDWPLNYQFMDQNLATLYAQEEKLGKIIRYFTMLAIFIACLGLLGLASFTAERRTKEIGVRKVLGATTPNLVMLISKDFTRLILIAFVIAIPIAYFAANRWLAEFAYRIDIGPGVFILAGLLALTIALLTVSYHAIRAAFINPVESLRYE